jgi:hypothetical protein
MSPARGAGDHLHPGRVTDVQMIGSTILPALAFGQLDLVEVADQFHPTAVLQVRDQGSCSLARAIT